jgi:hypothetical protein
MGRNEWAWTLSLLGSAVALRWLVGDVIGPGVATGISLLDAIGAALIFGGLMLGPRRPSSSDLPPPPRPDRTDERDS